MDQFGTFDMELLGITPDQIKEVNSSESEVVSRILMSKIKDIVATIRPDGIIFNTTCIRSMIGVIYIQMSIDREKHRLYVQPAEEYDKDSRRWCNEKNGKRVSRKITGRPFGDRVYKMMKWSKGYSYQVEGYPSIEEGTEGDFLLSFDLDEFHKNLLTEHGLASAGVDDIDLGEEAERIHAAIAQEKEQKEKAREETNASGKQKRSRKKSVYFGALEDGAFGIKKKEHENRVGPPLLEQLERITMTNDNMHAEQIAAHPAGGREP